MLPTLPQPIEIVQLSGISWNTYEMLLNELSHQHRLRLTYNRGQLEIMVPSPEHERYKKVIGRFVETLAEELDIRIEPLGSTTFKRHGFSGAEPDECFYVKNINRIQAKKRLDFTEDPSPDLVVEVDITSSSDSRLAVYKDLEIKEVWIYNGQSFKIMQLQHQDYVCCSQSLIFPHLALLEIGDFLQQVGQMDYLEIVKRFRTWVREQYQNHPESQL